MPKVHPSRNVLGLIGAFVVTSTIGGLLAAGLAMPAVGASGILTKNTANFFESLPSELTQEPQAETTRVLAADGTLLATFFDENRDIKPLKDISVNMQTAIIAIEDSRFYEHSGVDPKGLTRAAIVNQITGTAAQGASTLTQQYVKNVLIEAAVAKGDMKAANEARRKDTARKIEEVRYAVALEEKLSKDTILERYLNIAFFGNTLYGVQAAAKYYFGTTAKNLTLPQAATLAGMIQQPGAYNPEKNPKESLARRNVVLGRMLELKKIDQKTYDAAKATKLSLKITKTPNGCANVKHQYGYYCEYVRRLIVGSNDFSALGKTPTARADTILRGGLTIKTAMDPKIMKAAWTAVSEKIPPKDKSNVSTATVTVEPGTGKVLSIQQNKTYGNGKRLSGFRATNYSVDAKWGGGKGFQTGSTFKPFTLATWLDAGKSLNASVASNGRTVPFSSFQSCGSRLAGGSYTFQNSGEGLTGNANMSVWNGTAGSVNGVFVSMEQQLDLCTIRKTAESIGVHLASSRDDVCTAKKGVMTTRLPTCVPSLTLGVENISPMTMAGAYAAFAANGKFCKPTAVLQILDRNNKPVKIPGADCKQALDKEVAKGVNLGLSKVFKSGGTAASLGGLPGNRPASGKTGTTNSSVDTWFVGYTPQLATAVWVGDPYTYKENGVWARRSMNGRSINGTSRSGVYGVSFAAPIWKEIMTTASEDMDIETFDLPSGQYTSSPENTGSGLEDDNEDDNDNEDGNRKGNR